jgi:hypothetical protein
MAFAFRSASHVTNAGIGGLHWQGVPRDENYAGNLRKSATQKDLSFVKRIKAKSAQLEMGTYREESS